MPSALVTVRVPVFAPCDSCSFWGSSHYDNDFHIVLRGNVLGGHEYHAGRKLHERPGNFFATVVVKLADLTAASFVFFAACPARLELQKEVDSIETDYPDYDEYRYNLDAIGHDPFAFAVSVTSNMVTVYSSSSS